MEKEEIKYKRVLLKLSGEALMGEQKFGISPNMIKFVANEIASVYNLEIEIGIVIGGGNIFRGVSAGLYGMERTSADHIGMLATVINSIALQNALENLGIPARVQSALTMPTVAESHIIKKAVKHLNKKNVVIFAGGTGIPYFTTDTAAVLRAKEINADVLLKATKVDGIYDGDPEKENNVNFIKEIDYLEVVKKKLRFMDMAAVSLAMDNSLPVIVFNLKKEGNIKKIIGGEQIGSIVKNINKER